MSEGKDKLYKYIDLWYSLNKEISDKKERMAIIKEKIGSLMEKRQIKSLRCEEYTVGRVNRSRETVSKKDLPPDIWNKYCKRSEYSYLALKKKGVSDENLEDDLQ